MPLLLASRHKLVLPDATTACLSYRTIWIVWPIFWLWLVTPAFPLLSNLLFGQDRRPKDFLQLTWYAWLVARLLNLTFLKPPSSMLFCPSLEQAWEVYQVLMTYFHVFCPFVEWDGVSFSKVSSVAKAMKLGWYPNLEDVTDEMTFQSFLEMQLYLRISFS